MYLCRPSAGEGHGVGLTAVLLLFPPFLWQGVEFTNRCSLKLEMILASGYDLLMFS